MRALFIIFLTSINFMFAQKPIHNCDIDRLNYQSNEILEVSITKHKMTPSVVQYNATGNVKFEAFIVGAPTRVTLTVGTSNFDYVDNGTNGDAVAGDNTYTLLYPASSYLSALLADDAGRPFIGYLDIYEGANRTLRSNIIGQVRTADMPNVSVRSYDATKQATDYVFNLTGINVNANNLQTYAKQFYQHYGDKFDFLNFVLVPGYAGNRFHGSIRNNIAGIGLVASNSTASWGSAGAVQGFNVFPVPSFYDCISTGYIHEIAHQWINFTNGTPLATGNPHWPMSNLAAGSVMGFSLATGAGGTFNYTFTSQSGGYQIALGGQPSFPSFNKWELYLMGLIPKTEVTETAVILKSQAAVPTAGFYDNSNFIFHTITDFVGILGERNPSSATSQKAFKAATIIVSDELLPANELAYYDFMTRRAELTTSVQTREGLLKGIAPSFYVATGGRATLSTRISDPVSGVNSTQQNNSSIKIKQNTEGVIFVETDDIIKQVSVTNLMGQTMTITTANSLVINSLPTGIYIISVKTNYGFLSKKVFKR